MERMEARVIRRAPGARFFSPMVLIGLVVWPRRADTFSSWPGPHHNMVHRAHICVVSGHGPRPMERAEWGNVSNLGWTRPG
jgi:hypothetical protein